MLREARREDVPLTVAMLAVMEIARKRDCKSMQLLTNKGRVDAQRFYRSLGFENSHEGMKAKL